MDKMDRDMQDIVEEITAVEETTEVMQGEVEDFWKIKLKVPIRFEGKSYAEIDLTRLHDIKAADMITINRRMTRNGNIDISPEMTLEYALNMANIATGLPLEFFDQLPAYEAMKIKGRVTTFLYRQG